MYLNQMSGSSIAIGASSTVRSLTLFRVTVQHVAHVDAGSDVVHYEAFGTHMIVVNSARAANDLFEKRSALYNDRYALDTV